MIDDFAAGWGHPVHCDHILCNYVHNTLAQHITLIHLSDKKN